MTTVQTTALTDQVKPAAWMLRNLLDPQQNPWPTRVDSEAYKLAAKRDDFECVPLYDQATLNAAIADAVRAERERALSLVTRALVVCGGLAEQQAMPDDWWEAEAAAILSDAESATTNATKPTA